MPGINALIPALKDGCMQKQHTWLQDIQFMLLSRHTNISQYVRIDILSVQVVTAVGTHEVVSVDPLYKGWSGTHHPTSRSAEFPCVAIELPLYQSQPLRFLQFNWILTTISRVAVRCIPSFNVIICDICSYSQLALF